LHAYSLLELNNYIKRVIALNFEDAIWIECEISGISHVRGQVYLDLVQKDEDTQDVVAQSSAAIWYKANLFIKNKLKDLYSSILSQGIKIKCKVEVTFHERYGMKLSLIDIDPAYTMGNLEIERQKIIDKLTEKGLLDTNKHVTLCATIRQIAVISSSTAAGYIDFTNQLRTNQYGYKYEVTLYQSAMQGVNTETDVCDALFKIQNGNTHYDCICIIRGGGSKLDLSFFDSYKIAEAIATSNIPVITGIGHEIDLSVADIVSHTQLKTPTAVSNFIIDRTLYFESECLSVFAKVLQESLRKIKDKSQYLNILSQTLNYATQKKLLNTEKRLQLIESNVHNLATTRINTKLLNLDNIQSLLATYTHDNVLKRGYTLIRQSGKIVTSKAKLTDNPIEVQFRDGTVKRS